MGELQTMQISDYSEVHKMLKHDLYKLPNKFAFIVERIEAIQRFPNERTRNPINWESSDSESEISVS